MENKPETDGIGVLGSYVVDGSPKVEPKDQNQGGNAGDVDQGNEKEMDSGVDDQDVNKDDSIFAKETHVNPETDGDLGSIAHEGDQKTKLEEEKQNVQVGGRKQLENDQRARNYFVIQDEKSGFSVDELVWGKVRSHPWWPGQIFDPKYASDMALKCRKKDHLVAYFGDKSFAWVPASQLKPFQLCFSELVKQSSIEPFVNAVDDALEEVSRRVELGMSCNCLADETYANLNYRRVENDGILGGTCSSAVDRVVFVNAFQPEGILEYVCMLAQCPLEFFDRLDLTIATAHLKTFYHSKGYPEHPLFVFAGGLVDSDDEITLSKGIVSRVAKADGSNTAASRMKSGKRSTGRHPKKQVLEDDYKQKGQPKLKDEKDDQYLASSTAVPSSIKSGKKARGRLHKHYMSEDSSEQMEEEDADYPSRASGKKRKVVDSKSADVGRSKKGRVSKDLDSDYETPSSNRSRSLRVGDRISRIAGQLKKSPTISRKHSNLSSKAEEKNETSAQDYSSPREMLEQLCLVAVDHMHEYSVMHMTVGFFSKFRAYLSSMTSKDQDLGKSMGRTRGRKKKVDYNEPDSSEISEPDYMKDSYWADIILQSSPEREPVSRGRKRKGAFKNKGQKKIKPAGESLQHDPLDHLLDAEHIQLAEAYNPDEKLQIKGECIGNTEEKLKAEEPTTLILNFTGSDDVPSAAELNNIFSPYGPLREEETEVLRKTNRAKVVFRYRLDAEKAFSSAGKYSVFGPALVSYRLKYSPSHKSSPTASDGSHTKDELQAQEGTEADVDNI